MNPHRRWLSWLLIIVFLLLGLSLLVLDILPGRSLKSLADSLMPDGEFESLTTGNISIFKFVFTLASLFFIALAALTYFHRWKSVLSFYKQFWADARSSVRGIFVIKGEILSLLALLILIAAAVAYRMEYLFSSLHHDEAYTYMAFAHSLRAAITDYHLPNNHVFHSILVYFSTRIFGNAPWVVRLPAFTAGVLLVPAVYALAKRHYNRWVGLGAALLVVASPALVGYSDNARGYTLVALFGVLLLLLGHTVCISRNLFAWVLIVLVSALGMYTIPAFLFPFGVLYVWLLLEGRFAVPPGYASRLDFLKYWLLSGFSAAALTLVFYLPILLYTGPEALFSNAFVSPIPWPDFLETLFQRLIETWAEWTLRVPLVGILLVIAGWILSLVFHRKISSTRLPLQLAALLWIAFLLIAQRPNAWSKIWVFLLPLALLWAAAGIFGLLGLLKLRSIPGSALAFGLLFVIVVGRAAWLLPQLPELWSIHGDEENAVLYVESHMDPGDGLVVAPPDDAPVWYYAELHGLSAMVTQPGSDPARLFVLVNPVAGQTPASVLEERGPGLVGSSSCTLLHKFGKIQVFECQESP